MAFDDVADEWLNTLSSGTATALRSKYMTYNVTDGDHTGSVGISPFVVGEAGGFFQDMYGADTMVVYGGCPLINDFDVLVSQGTANLEMSYHGDGNTARDRETGPRCVRLAGGRDFGNQRERR